MRIKLLNEGILDIAAALMPRSYDTIGKCDSPPEDEEKEED